MYLGLLMIDQLNEKFPGITEDIVPLKISYLQLEQWTTLAKARAIENEIYVVGCSHFDGAIPLAYAFEASGKCVLMKKGGRSYEF
ncbi:hypothetical protein SAMN02910358_00502 [Lachnospiraceae bacterium XBB1006]|nr:hypothetical protein SAMN02910358_00502 [Lachnospiraceae bacterium XBB1006]